MPASDSIRPDDHEPDHPTPEVPSGVARRRVLQVGGGLAVASALPASLGPGSAAAATAPAAGAAAPATLREGTNMMVVASPDGRWLALDLVVSIWVLPTTGGKARRLTVDAQDATRPAWSPDGKRIAFQSYRDGTFHIWSIGVDGTGLTQHTSGRYDHREPCWLPDGSGLLVSSDRGGAGTYGIYRLDLASGRISTVVDGGGEDAEPTVSPDGTRVTFTVDALRIDAAVIATGARRTVVPARDGSFVYGPSLSPDSGTLAYVRLTGPRSDLVTGDEALTDGADVFALPPSRVSDRELVYTADGQIRRQPLTGAQRSSPSGPPSRCGRVVPGCDAPTSTRLPGGRRWASPVRSRPRTGDSSRSAPSTRSGSPTRKGGRAHGGCWPTATSTPTPTLHPTAAAWSTPATGPATPTCGSATSPPDWTGGSPGSPGRRRHRGTHPMAAGSPTRTRTVSATSSTSTPSRSARSRPPSSSPAG